MVTYTRLLKKGTTGEDVKFVKDSLHELGYYTGVARITHSKFGSDTVNAVKKFQEENNLEVDGIVGPITWNALVNKIKKNTPEKKPERTPIPSVIYQNISASVISQILEELLTVSVARYEFVIEALKYAYDHNKGGDIKSLYMWGGNLYDKSLNLNIASKSKIEKGAKTYPSNYNNGRKEMMLKAIKKNPKLAASDCSGMIVGILRKFEYVAPHFDATANTLCSNNYSASIKKKDLKPGDFVGYTGHIGLYAGGGWVVEFAGGEYGCQVTSLEGRQRFSFIKNKLIKGSKWSKFRDPKFY